MQEKGGLRERQQPQEQGKLGVLRPKLQATCEGLYALGPRPGSDQARRLPMRKKRLFLSRNQLQQAIEDGSFPLDARRIAENFAELERLI